MSWVVIHSDMSLVGQFEFLLLNYVVDVLVLLDLGFSALLVWLGFGLLGVNLGQ